VDILIDTNVIIDIAQSREPFVPVARKLLNMEGLRFFITASAVTDIYYIQRKHAGHAQAREFLSTLFRVFGILDVTGADCRTALMLNMPDYEDALQAVCARKAKCSFIITRDEQHYEGTPVPAITSERFLEEWSAHGN